MIASISQINLLSFWRTLNLKEGKGLKKKGRNGDSSHQYLELNARFCYCAERCGLPVCLLRLLPHDHIEAGAVLVTENKAGIVIICLGIYVEGPFKVNSIKRRVP